MSVKNTKVEFPGHGTFWLIIDALAPLEQCDSDGRLTDEAVFFGESYAHIFPDGRIIRYGKTIGTRDDLIEI